MAALSSAGGFPGDRIRPERGRGGKKLKAWLIDRKVPREHRDGLIVLADADGNVLALPELGIRSAGGGLPRRDGPPRPGTVTPRRPRTATRGKGCYKQD